MKHLVFHVVVSGNPYVSLFSGASYPQLATCPTSNPPYWYPSSFIARTENALGQHFPTTGLHRDKKRTPKLPRNGPSGCRVQARCSWRVGKEKVSRGVGECGFVTVTMAGLCQSTVSIHEYRVNLPQGPGKRYP